MKPGIGPRVDSSLVPFIRAPFSPFREQFVFDPQPCEVSPKCSAEIVFGWNRGLKPCRKATLQNEASRYPFVL